MLQGQSDSEPLRDALQEVESRLASLGFRNARLTEDTALPPNLEGLPPLSDSVTTLLPPLFPKPVTTSPWMELKILSDSFYGIRTSICAKFIQYPPSELEAREHQCKKLRETILAEIILGVDAIETWDNHEAGLIKRKIIIDATEAVRRCNQVVSSTTTRESRRAQAEAPVSDYSGLDAEQYVRRLHLTQLEEERLRRQILTLLSRCIINFERGSSVISLQRKIVESRDWPEPPTYDLEALRSRLHLLETRSLELEKIRQWIVECQTSEEKLRGVAI